MRSFRTLLIALALSTATATPAFGAPPSTPSAAQDANAARLFDEGQTLFDKGDHAAALERFRAAYEASGSPNARLMAARSLLALGRLAEAYDEFEATRAEAAAKAETQKKYAKARDAAASELAALEPKVGKVVVALSHPDGAKVILAGAPLAPERLGLPVAVKPGKVTVEVEMPGLKPVRREENVAAGQTKTVFVAPGDAGTASSGASAGSDGGTKADATEPSKRTGGGVRVAGFAVAGLGVVGLGTFAVTAALAQQKYDTLTKECGGKRCTDPKYADTVDAGKRLDTIALASVIVGGVAAATGAVMIALGGPKEEKRATPTVAVGPDGAMVGLVGTF
jgi:hypothetical protein